MFRPSEKPDIDSWCLATLCSPIENCLYKGGSLPPQLLIQVDTKMVNLSGQCIQTEQTKFRVMVWQNDGINPVKSAMSVRCHDHLLHTEVRGYLCFLPLLLAFNKTLYLLFGSFLSFFLSSVLLTIQRCSSR